MKDADIIRRKRKSRTVKVDISEEDPLWYKDAIIYQLHVRSFYDSNNDGIGDFRGLTQKLEYIKDLGVTAIWLLPFFPSPLRDDGYDIADYTSINPIYGSLKDCKEFLQTAHHLGLKVIGELVLNHTSDQHEWFQRARRAPVGSSERNFYVWSDSPDKYQETRIIFKDFETSNWTWDPVAHSYYWHRFYSHQPDLNFENPEVQKTLFQVVDFWLKMGLDGLRLDAVPYLFEKEGTNCENLPETHWFLKKLREHIDKKFKCRMLLSEANQWPEDAVAYMGNGDECHMNFHFPLMPRMFMSLSMEDRFPIIDILDQTPEIPENCQWATFLRNHDELTLEMVTDEERDYMYRMYAAEIRARVNLGIRRRLAPLLGNNRRQIELLVALLFSLPGTPIIYYGDEIGMGDNIYLGDRNGVRTPLQWSSDSNAGFSRANPQQLFLPVIIDPEYHYEAINIESQQRNPHSLLWWMKRIINLRKEWMPLRRGKIHTLHPDNKKVFCFIRSFEEEHVLIVANLSRFSQYVELDLSDFRGHVPVELFGRTEFPPIGELPYLLTLNRHSFYWFSLQHMDKDVEAQAERTIPVFPKLFEKDKWESIFRDYKEAQLKKFLKLLPHFLNISRWYSGKNKVINHLQFLEIIPLSYSQTRAFILLPRVTYVSGEQETYLLPLTFSTGDKGRMIEERFKSSIICQVNDETNSYLGFFHDASIDPFFNMGLLEILVKKRILKGREGEVQGFKFKRYHNEITTYLAEDKKGEEFYPLSENQSNTNVVFAHKFILKFYRRLDEGANPDAEIGHYLGQQDRPGPVAPIVGTWEYRRGKNPPMTLGILHQFIPNQGNAWDYAMDAIERFYEGALTMADFPIEEAGITQEFEAKIKDSMGLFLTNMSLLAERTAELHLALSRTSKDPAFNPEPFTTHYQRSLYQAARFSLQNNFSLLKKFLGKIPVEFVPMAKSLLSMEEKIKKEDLVIIYQDKIQAQRTRIHGDLHLGQVLFTGKDFIIIDFEGEPAKAISERRIKQSPLRDVAGILRSFHYVAVFSLYKDKMREEDRKKLLPIFHLWPEIVSSTFLESYYHRVGEASFLPAHKTHREVLIKYYLLEKAFYELGYELSYRPNYVFVPIQGIFDLISSRGS